MKSNKLYRIFAYVFPVCLFFAAAAVWLFIFGVVPEILYARLGTLAAVLSSAAMNIFSAASSISGDRETPGDESGDTVRRTKILIVVLAVLIVLWLAGWITVFADVLQVY